MKQVIEWAIEFLPYLILGWITGWVVGLLKQISNQGKATVFYLSGIHHIEVVRAAHEHSNRAKEWVEGCKEVKVKEQTQDGK